MKEGVFVGPQVRGLIREVKCEDQLSKVEKAAWKSLSLLMFWDVVGRWLFLYNPARLWAAVRL
jgi:hypothetical protein